MAVDRRRGGRTCAGSRRRTSRCATGAASRRTLDGTGGRAGGPFCSASSACGHGLGLGLGSRLCDAALSGSQRLAQELLVLVPVVKDSSRSLVMAQGDARSSAAQTTITIQAKTGIDNMAGGGNHVDDVMVVAEYGGRRAEWNEVIPHSGRSTTRGEPRVLNLKRI